MKRRNVSGRVKMIEKMRRRVLMRESVEKMKGREDVKKNKNERSSGGERKRSEEKNEKVWRRVRMREYVEDSEN